MRLLVLSQSCCVAASPNYIKELKEVWPGGSHCSPPNLRMIMIGRGKRSRLVISPLLYLGLLKVRRRLVGRIALLAATFMQVNNNRVGVRGF